MHVLPSLMARITIQTFLLIAVYANASSVFATSNRYDVVIYGGTSSGVIAAIQAKRMGKSVILVSPDVHVGGLSSGGLGWTDTGDKSVIGGLAREFYHRVWKHYQKEDAWRWQTQQSRLS